MHFHGWGSFTWETICSIYEHLEVLMIGGYFGRCFGNHFELKLEFMEGGNELASGPYDYDFWCTK